MRVNVSPVFDDFPFIMSAKDKNSVKIIKILRVAVGSSELTSRDQDRMNEIHACNFAHEAIVPMRHACIQVDNEIATKAHCRVGETDVLIMPWYRCTLNKYPSGDLEWIVVEGKRVSGALEYIHLEGFVHLDVKAMNVFVDHNSHWFLGDFGSCKPIGMLVTSSTFQFCYEDIGCKPAHPKYDWFMFLLLILIESLKDRRTYNTLFYTAGCKFANFNLVIEYANKLVGDEPFGMFIRELLDKLHQSMA
jgi:serine/threonine protein kinase